MGSERQGKGERGKGVVRDLVDYRAHCNTLQYTAAHCSTPQHTATHCDTLHHMRDAIGYRVGKKYRILWITHL